MKDTWGKNIQANDTQSKQGMKDTWGKNIQANDIQSKQGMKDTWGKIFRPMTRKVNRE